MEKSFLAKTKHHQISWAYRKQIKIKCRKPIWNISSMFDDTILWNLVSFLLKHPVHHRHHWKQQLVKASSFELKGFCSWPFVISIPGKVLHTIIPIWLLLLPFDIKSISAASLVHFQCKHYAYGRYGTYDLSWHWSLESFLPMKRSCFFVASHFVLQCIQQLMFCCRMYVRCSVSSEINMTTSQLFSNPIVPTLDLYSYCN